jgi:hypothetical protein
MDRNGLVAFLSQLFPNNDWPKPLHLLRGVALVGQGSSVRDAARAVGTSEKKLAQILDAADPVSAVIGERGSPPEPQEITRKQDMLGQLVLGKAAEKVFEGIYKKELGASEFRLDDQRGDRSDTDYRMLNGGKRPVYRINIKFVGSLFRQARERVGLEPEDCFALATYKIHAALKKQEEEHLPYLFLVISVPDLTGRFVASQFKPEELETLLFLLLSDVERKRDLEDRFVELCAENKHPAFNLAYERMSAVTWYVLSARRADRLLRQLLFERVFALKMRSFAQHYRNAELDMHFSLKNDLNKLSDFLRVLRDGGLQRSTTMLERGDV